MDYYRILDVDKSCSLKDIDISYKKLVLLWHPDKNKQENAIIKFREIMEAYRILSNPETRKKYDNENIQEQQIPDVIIKIKATLKQLYTGFVETVSFDRFSECNKCEATGTKDKTNVECVNCKGVGLILEVINLKVNEIDCYVCSGSGINPTLNLCTICDGHKFIKETVECEIDIVAGAYDNYIIRSENEGNIIPVNERIHNKIRTDLIVVIEEIKDDIYKRGVFIQELKKLSYADLLMTINISFAESIIGFQKELIFIDDTKFGIKIDTITQTGDMHIIKYAGMPNVPEGNNTRGDLFIRIIVNKPNLTKQKINKIYQIITDKPYPDVQNIKNIKNTINYINYINQ